MLVLVPYIVWPFLQNVLETLNLNSGGFGYSSDSTGSADEEYNYQVGQLF